MAETTLGNGRGRRGRAARATRGLAIAGAVVAAAAGGLIAAPAAQAEATDVSSGSLDWGLRDSWRSYVVGPIAHGTISPSGGATQNPGNGTFVFSGGTGAVDPAAATASVDYAGTVRFAGHDGLLDTTVSGPSLSVSGTAVTLNATVSSKSLDTGETTNYGEIPFATFTITSGSLTPNGSGLVTASTGAGTFTDQAVEALGGFYSGTNNYTDPLTFTAQTEDGPATPGTPSVTVSKTTVDPAGDTVTVTGTGFDPALATGTRPPLSGRPAGVYVAFGRYQDVWKPSAGAPSSARVNGPSGTSVKWAVLAADRATVGEDASVTLSPDGGFTAEIQVGEDLATFPDTGNWGIFTYAGSGAVTAAYETYTPLTFSTTPPTGGTTATQTIVTTITDTGALTLSVAGSQVTLPTPELSEDGSRLVTSGSLNPVQVTDTRSANPGWSVSGQLSDFTSPAGTLDGKYLGWTPSVTSTADGQTVTAGAAVAPGTGFKASAPLGTAAAGVGRGTAVLGAGLSLAAPSETVPGTYTATLTLTAI